MGIPQMSTRLLGLHPAGALHQHACDDLKAVGDPVLHLLQMDRFLANVFVLFSGFGANERDVRYRQQEPDAERAAVIKFAGVQQQTSRLMALPSSSIS